MSLFGFGANKKVKEEIEDQPENQPEDNKNLLVEAESRMVNFEWINSDREEKAKKCLELAKEFEKRDSPDQTELQLNRLCQLSFEDFCERVKLNADPINITYVDGRADRDDFNIIGMNLGEKGIGNESSYSSLNDVPFRIPTGAVEAMEKVKDFSLSEELIEETEIWDTKSVDPILVVKVRGQWYSVYNWERFGSTIVSEE